MTANAVVFMQGGYGAHFAKLAVTAHFGEKCGPYPLILAWLEERQIPPGVETGLRLSWGRSWSNCYDI